MGSRFSQYIFQRHTPSPAGERRYASVMFADLVQSTQLISGLEIDEAQELIDRFVSDTCEVIHEFGGTVARVQGDGILALFGAPVAQEDHVQMAALAALEISRRCRASEATGQTVAVRIGLHCGELGLRWQNNDFGKSLDVVGATAHVAGKIQQSAPLNSVMVSRDLAEQLGPDFTCSGPQGEVIAGEAFEVRQLVSHASSHAAPAPSIERSDHADELIGREDIVTLIEQTLAQNTGERGGHGEQIIGLTGAPGIGKSRLLIEAEQCAQRCGRPVLRALGRSLDRALPFGAFANLRLHAAGTTAQSGSSHIAGEPLDLLKSLEDYALEQEDWDTLSPDSRNERAAIYLTAKIQALNPAGELCLIFDDYHFLDSETKRLVARLARRLRESGGTMIIGTRPECQAEIDLLADNNCVLSPLSEDAAHRFVRKLWVASGMERKVLPNTFGQTIQQRAQGMPLALRHFSFHCIAMVKEGKDPMLALPHQLDTIFRSQIDGLSDELRTVFQAGCVLGYEFGAAELSALMGLGHDDVRAALAQLIELEMVTRLDGDNFRFAHQLLQEAGYHGILRRPRDELHRQAYEWLNTAEATGPVSAQVLGWHASQAGLTNEALDHYVVAMREAIAQGAILTVDELYMQARPLCDMLGEEGRDRRAVLLLYAFDALQQLGKTEWYRGDVEDAIARFKRQGDAFRTALATNHLAITDWTGGRNQKSLETAREGARLADLTGHEPLIIYGQFTLGNIEFLCGEPQAGMERLKSLVDRLGGVKRAARFGDMISVPGIMARTFSSWYLYDMGEDELARRYCAEGRELAEHINQNYSYVLADIAEAYLFYRDGAYAQASAVLEAAVKRCAKHAIYGLETIASARYMCSLVGEGRLEEAEAILTRHRTDGHLNPVQHSCAYYRWEGEARLLASRGQYEDALGVLDVARLESEKQNDPLHALHARVLACEMAHEHGATSPHWPGEVNAIRKAAGEFGFLPIAARCDALGWTPH